MNLSDRKIAEKVIEGTSSKENATRLVHWFASSMEGQQTLSDMIDRDAYMMEDNPEIRTMITPMQSDGVFEKIQAQISRKRLIRLSLRVAAVLLPFIVIVGLGFYINSRVDLFGPTVYAEMYVPKGEKARVLFQDGTEVFLNSDSKIRYPKKFGFKKRNVYLQGEAYFNVASGKRPFIVETGNVNVRVLGTSFNINSYDSDKTIRVVLDEGRVLFNSPTNRYQLSPGQQLIYDKAKGSFLLQNLSRSSNLSLWKNNILYLRDTPLEEVLQILERNHNVSFFVKDPSVFKYSYTITTEEKRLENILEELQKIAPVKFTRRHDGFDVLGS